MAIASRTPYPESLTSATPASLFVRVSANRKVGPMPVTSSKKSTCPPSCPLMNNGCYAASGPTAFAWRRAEPSRAEPRTASPSMIFVRRSEPKGTLWRHNVAGDLPGDGDQIDGEL